MNFFILVGPPGAGKGTQSSLLKERLGFIHVSTGALIREEIATQSPLGRSVKSAVESGNYVDDKMILECLMNHLKNLDSNSKNIVLLDGIPRNINQANALDKSLGTQLKGVIALTANLEDLVGRFVKRWVCANCGRVESFEITPSSDYECKSCHALGKFERRKDDSSEIVRSRFKIYTKQTEELLEFYKNRQMLYEFDALQSIEYTYVNVAALILQKNHGIP